MNDNHKIDKHLILLVVFLVNFGLKAQTATTYYGFQQKVDPFGLATNSNGDCFYVKQASKENINKVDVSGNVSVFFTGNYSIPLTGYYALPPTVMVFDNLDNLYFIDVFNPLITINKVDANGIVSVFVSDSNYNPLSITIDNLGNLYFIDESNVSYSIKKVDSNGIVSSYFSDTNYAPGSLTCDNSGNLYFIDQNNQTINKILPDGSVSLFVNGTYDAESFTFDNSGNLYFIDRKNYPSTIKKVLPDGTMSTYMSNDSSMNLSNLVSDSLGNLYFLNISFDEDKIMTILNPNPIVSISGNTSGNDFVNLTASGGETYLWSGGNFTTSATNYFTTSATYSVKVTNAGGYSNTKLVNVVVNKKGINKYGELTADYSSGVSTNGTIGATTYLNKHGKINSLIPYGDLNYKVFKAPDAYPTNATDFSNFTNPFNQYSSGIYSANLLLNWSSWSSLTTAGILIPNGGEFFAVEISGFFIPQETGTYTFTCEGDDSVDLFINNVNIASQYGPNGASPLGTHTGSIYLVAGTKYVFRARQKENTGLDGLMVFWRRQSEATGWNIYPSELSSE